MQNMAMIDIGVMLALAIGVILAIASREPKKRPEDR